MHSEDLTSGINQNKMGIILSNYFNTQIPIIDSLVNEAMKNRNDLTDHKFTQAINEYEADELEVMEEMMKQKDYKFKRYSTGWMVTPKINKHGNKI